MDTAAITGAPAPTGGAPPPAESRATGGAEVPARQRVNATRESDRAPAGEDRGAPARDRGPGPDAGPRVGSREIRVSREVAHAVFESVSRGSDNGAERSRADADRAYTAAARATERPSVARNSLDLV